MPRTGIMASVRVETAGGFMERIRWGILGAGSIAQRFVAALARVEGAELVAISGRNAERLSAFAAKYRVDMGKCYASADDNGWKAHECLLLDDDVDAVYIALPHGLHATWSCRALRAGKAVLCEKPAVLTGSQADEVARAARGSGTLFMEAMKPRFTPVRSRVHELLDSGELGAVASVDVVHLLDYGELRDSYLLDPDQGGTLYDLGCYGVAWTEDILTGDVAVERAEARWIEGRGGASVDIADEVRLRIGDVPVRLDFSGDSQAYKVECRIDCERGSILVPMFHRPSSLLVTRGNGEPMIEDMPLVVDDFYGEVEHFCGLMRSGKSESPIMPLASTVRTAQIIDAIRAAWDPRPVPHQA